MDGGELVRRARRRAGISQTELARRIGTRQPVIARWERRRQSPTLESVARAVAACGLRLDVAVTSSDAGDEALLREWSRLSPAERLQRNQAMLATEAWARRARRAEEGP